ncbi:MAG: site-specific integrase [Bacilli bacterium]|jgi:integrase|nr:site-specific integrase [Bacilli bacterium]
MLGLRWEDVDLAGKAVFIRRQRQRSGEDGLWHDVETKTPSSVRHLRLSPFLAGELYALKGAEGAGPGDFLFFGRKGIRKHPVVSALQGHCRAAGVPVISPHEIRHTVAFWLVAACKDMSDLIVVQRWLGHTSLKETLDTYSHYLKRGDGGAISTLDDV